MMKLSFANTRTSTKTKKCDAQTSAFELRLLRIVLLLIVVMLVAVSSQ